MSASRLHNSPLLSLGFRPFFLGAALYAVVAVALWMAMFVFHRPAPFAALSAFQWHAHEMLYGYSLAVIAGFLLTAVGNWTGRRMPHGYPLLVLFALWAGARMVQLSGWAPLTLAGVLDLLFIGALLIAVAAPCIRARQWRQSAIIGKLLLLVAGNAAFYAGAGGVLVDGVYWGNYGGLYVVIGLILTMGRRVVPFFIEKGVDYPLTLKNSRLLDITSMLLFLGFFVSEVFTRTPLLSAWLCLGLLAVNSIRLAWWHTPAIWRAPLLWSLYLALVFINLGFALFAAGVFAKFGTQPALHAFAYGGIGLVTLSMMSRVSLGHTGRNVHQAPRGLGGSFLLLVAGTLVRLSAPFVAGSHYAVWIGISQLLWIAAFIIFLVIYAPILARSNA